MSFHHPKFKMNHPYSNYNKSSNNQLNLVIDFNGVLILKIRMKVLASEEIHHMNCVMLSRLGAIYPCVENGFHPNCGSKEQGYPDVYSVVDWMIDNRVNRGCNAVNKWLLHQLRECYDMRLDFQMSIEMIFSGIIPSDRIIEVCTRLWNDIDTVSYDEAEVLKSAEAIDFYLNQNFLRVISGGKFNSAYSNSSIYFRISSKDYNWRDVIEDFLWDVFKSIDKMPKLIWIGHDAETNPPEIVLFEGTPKELFGKFDSKIFASKVFD